MLRALVNDPNHWRSRAEEARAISDQMTDAEAKRMMAGIAADYDRLAARAEERLLLVAKNPTVPLPQSK
jgi:hypothetical protein